MTSEKNQNDDKERFLPENFRVRFQEGERKQGWLPLLMEAYAIVDAGVARAIEEQGAERGVKLACRKGCDSCCNTHSDIPVYPLELLGLYWFVMEELREPARGALLERLRTHRAGEGRGCPFLLEGACAVHLIRPAACRQFNVFRKKCKKGEDAWHSRPGDVLKPLRHYLDRAFYVTLPFYGVKDEERKMRIIREKALDEQVVNLQNYDWRVLYDKVLEYEEKKRRTETVTE